MRNLKRALALVMATAMLIGMMVTSAGAGYEDFTDYSEIENTEAVGTMVTLGVINGRDTGEFDPTGTVTRAEMAKMITVSLNGGSDPILGSGAATTTFTDTSGHWAEAYIAYCANLGIINGYGDGTFGPDDTVTGTAAAKMMLVALGYDATMEGMTGTGWDLNTDILANKVGLYEGFDSVSVSAGLSRDYAAQLIYNGVQADTVEYDQDYYGSDLYYVVYGDSMLLDSFGVVRVEGTVTANEYANVTPANTSNPEGRTTLSDIELSDEHTFNDGDGNDDGTFYVSTGVEELGRTVTLFVKKDSVTPGSFSKATVVGEVIIADENVVVESTADGDTLKDVADDNKLTFAGTYLSNFKIAIETSYELVVGDSLVLIDNDDDGDVDYAFVTAYTFGEVTTYNSSDEEVFVKGQSEDEYDFEDVVGLDEIAHKDFVNYAEIGGKLYVELAEIVTGEMTKYSNSSDYLTVDGTSYDYSGLLFQGGIYNTDVKTVDATDLGANLDEEVTIYLDILGNVIGMEAGAVSTDFALIIAAGVESSSLSSSYLVKAVLSDGTTAVYDLDEYEGTDAEDVTLPDLVGNIYNYSVSGDSIDLYDTEDVNPGGTNGAKATVEITNGKVGATFNGSNEYATDSTVFFYVSLDATDDQLSKTTSFSNAVSTYFDDASVYVGYDNVKSLDMSSDDEKTEYVYYYDDDNNLAAVGVIVDGTGLSEDWMYIVEVTGTTSSGYTVNAVIDGEYVTGLDISDDGDDPSEGVGYSFVESDGEYELASLTGEGTGSDYLSGHITYKGTKSVLIKTINGIVEVEYDSDTTIGTIGDDDDTVIDGAMIVGDYVYVIMDGEDYAYAILVEETLDSRNTSLLEVDDDVVKDKDNETSKGVSKYTATNAVDSVSDLESYIVTSYDATLYVYSSYNNAEAGTNPVTYTGADDESIAAGNYYVNIVSQDGNYFSTIYVTIAS